jgi:hypothetical protein
MELAKRVCACVCGPLIPCAWAPSLSDDRLRLASVPNWNGKSGGKTTPSLRCFARRSARRLGLEWGLGVVLEPPWLALAACAGEACVGNGKAPGDTDESGAVLGGSGSRERRVGVRGSLRCSAGRGRRSAVGDGVGVDGREAESASMVSSHTGNWSHANGESRVLVLWG